MDNDIFGFIEEFFINVGSKVDYDKDVMKVTNIPKNIQDFLCKKEPYLFSVVDTKNKDVEILTKGSFILKNMDDYIKSKGQTTLLKIDFSNKVENLKVPIILKEGDMISQVKKEIMEYIFRFTFSSEFQYLNNKENILNDIYLKGEDILNIDLDGLDVIEGNPKEISYFGVDYAYTFAKNYIKHKLKPDVEKLSNELSIKLDKEIERINNHYSSQDDEITQKITKLENNLVETKKEDDKKKIARIENEIKELKEKLNDRVKEAEKNFFIQDEINKHSINLNTKLVNSTVIYYPNYKFSVQLKNKKSMRMLDIDFDPFNNKFSSVYCDSCKLPLSEIYLCSSGHISCDKCPKERCKECQLIICKSCTKKECNICKSKLCKKCDRQCSVCFKNVCPSHGLPEKNSTKIICNDCGRKCCRCEGWFDNKKLKLFGPKKICEACLRVNSIGK